MLVNTRRAAEVTGLSPYELRRGWKAGIYPALLIGCGDQRRRLRWNLDALEEAILRNMEKGDFNGK